jgi:uncharacterized protein
VGDIKFDTQTTSFDDLESKYSDFYAPGYAILVDETNLLQQNIAFRKVEVISRFGASDTCKFYVTNAFDLVARKFKWLDDYFTIGKTLEIKMGYVDKLETVFVGLITSVTFDYPSGSDPELVIEGMDATFLMMQGKHSNTWNEKKHSDIAKEIGGNYVSTLKVDDTDTQYESVSQQNTDDYKYLTDIAQQNGYEFFVVGKTMYFRKPFQNTAAVTTLTWGKNLMSFSPKFDIASLVGSVTVRGRDIKQQQEVEATSQSSSATGAWSDKVSSLMQTIGKKVKQEIVYTNMTTAAEVQAMANVLLEERAREYLSGKGTCLGLPELIAGRYIKLEFVGAEFSKPVFLSTVTHTIDSKGFVTNFAVGGGKSAVEKLVKASDNEASESAKSKGLTQGVMVAIVTDNKDPDGLARVKLKFPMLEGDEESDWARLSSLMAGNDRGSLFIPEVGDEVLVAFHMGDISEPYVLGTLWNTKQPSPKVDGDKNNIRKFKSRAGHELIFDDDDSAGKVTIHTKKGHIIEFTDENDTIKIADSSGNNTISVVGGSTNEISVKSSSTEIKINAQGAITINGTQSVKVTAPQISLEANATLDLKASGSLNITSDGLLNIKGSMVKIN